MTDAKCKSETQDEWEAPKEGIVWIAWGSAESSADSLTARGSQRNMAGSGVCPTLVRGPVFKTGEGSRERLLVGSIPIRSRHHLHRLRVKVAT